MNNKTKREHYLNAQEKRLDLFFEENLNNYENLTITSTEKSPMGSLIINGYINNNKKLNFDAYIRNDTHYQFDNSLGYSEKIGKMFKTSRDKKISPSEIIKEKHLNKEDYEADPPFFF